MPPVPRMMSVEEESSTTSLAHSGSSSTVPQKMPPVPRMIPSPSIAQPASFNT
ncbi:hypothetical protein G9A89_000562, partial [Geosiphon pyriformis]